MYSKILGFNGLELKKGGTTMDNQNVKFDWKFVIALGVAPAIVILASKMDAEAAERVLTNAVNTFGGFAFALEGSC